MFCLRSKKKKINLENIWKKYSWAPQPSAVKKNIFKFHKLFYKKNILSVTTPCWAPCYSLFNFRFPTSRWTERKIPISALEWSQTEAPLGVNNSSSMSLRSSGVINSSADFQSEKMKKFLTLETRKFWINNSRHVEAVCNRSRCDLASFRYILCVIWIPWSVLLASKREFYSVNLEIQFAICSLTSIERADFVI